MNKVISFSLWGKNPLYWDGMIQNAILAPKIYPGWKIRVYTSNDFSVQHVESLRYLGCDVIHLDDTRGPWVGLFWRFLPCSDPDVDIMLSRDADSRLNLREKACVDDWLNNTDYGFSVIRDHREHNVPILGGTFGCKKGVLPNMKEMIDNWGSFYRKGLDQDMLRALAWPIVKDNHVAYDELHGFSGKYAKPFPYHPSIEPLKFVGEIVDARR